MSDTGLYLLRHARSTASVDAPNACWQLNQIGISQAQDLTTPLTQLNIDKVFSSPYQRAIDTISPFCQPAGINILIESDLRERMYSSVYIPDGWDQLMETAFI